MTSFVDIPQDVLRPLSSDKSTFPDGFPTTLHCEAHEQAEKNEPSPQILCRSLPLSIQGEDYLVIGVGSLRGAHILPFWILHRDSKGASLILKTAADQIVITPKRVNSYFEVQASWILGAGTTIITDTFYFDGNKYIRSRRKTEHR